MKKKALLLAPGYYEFGDYGYNDQPFMGLLKIARHFKNQGIDVEYHDFSIPPIITSNNNNLKDLYEGKFKRFIKCGNYEEEGIMKAQKYYGAPYSYIEEVIKNAKPTEIWLSSGLTYYWEAVQDIAFLCKKHHPNVPLLLGGIYATLFPGHAQKYIPCDYIHVGPFEDIDHLMPDYSVDLLRAKSSTRTIQIAKGCHLKVPCTWCAVHAMDNKFRGIDPDPTFAYMRQEYANGVNFFRFWASQLLVPLGKFKDLMNKVISSDMKVSMNASEGVQPSLFDQEVSDLMYKAGFISVSIPMESIDQKTIEDFRKPSTFSDYENSVDRAQRSGFKKIKSFVMAGVPGQTYSDMVRAIVDCWARDVTPAIHQYTPIPGSNDWTKYPQFQSYSPEELHPSLWPGASSDMKVSYLEEIKRIGRLGLYNFNYMLQNKNNFIKEIKDIYEHWCHYYGLIKNGESSKIMPLALPGYQSEWMTKLKERNYVPMAQESTLSSPLEST